MNSAFVPRYADIRRDPELTDAEKWTAIIMAAWASKRASFPASPRTIMSEMGWSSKSKAERAFKGLLARGVIVCVKEPSGSVRGRYQFASISAPDSGALEPAVSAPDPGAQIQATAPVSAPVSAPISAPVSAPDPGEVIPMGMGNGNGKEKPSSSSSLSTPVKSTAPTEDDDDEISADEIGGAEAEAGADVGRTPSLFAVMRQFGINTTDARAVEIANDPDMTPDRVLRWIKAARAKGWKTPEGYLRHMTEEQTLGTHRRSGLDCADPDPEPPETPEEKAEREAKFEAERQRAAEAAAEAARVHRSIDNADAATLKALLCEWKQSTDGDFAGAKFVTKPTNPVCIEWIAERLKVAA